MQTTHTTTVVARCPKGGSDIYEVSFTVQDRVLEVEEIERAVADLVALAIFQEDLTRRLADILTCQVRSSGRHGPSGRYLTTGTAGAP